MPSFLARALPGWVPYAAVAILLVVVAGWGYGRGASDVQERWDIERARQQTVVAVVKQRQAEVTARVITKFADRVRTVREAGDTIIREVPVYVRETCDPDGRLPAGWRVQHDAAAAGGPADPAGFADATPVAPDTAAETVARNYLACRLNAEQLTALQAWVREQAAVVP
ncbi:hypothetical protein [Methyloversatilis sp.]|uniref:hypothetical protein n=1 Tax=Methyloversatilis sp. TaxID=2569862 RepID=UPI003D2846A3